MSVVEFPAVDASVEVGSGVGDGKHRSAQDDDECMNECSGISRC